MDSKFLILLEKYKNGTVRSRCKSSVKILGLFQIKLDLCYFLSAGSANIVDSISTKFCEYQTFVFE